MIAAYLFGIGFSFYLGWKSRDMDEEDCPRRVLQYNCRGDRCDHSEVELRKNQLTMAKNRERTRI